MINQQQSYQNQNQQLCKQQIIQTSSSTFFSTFLLPATSNSLLDIFSQLKLFSKQRLDDNICANLFPSLQQIKGLKFISSKLARLFTKNRKLPYNQISKILISNFASQTKDQRNIKRRVYDAINVLVSAGILIKKNNMVEMVKDKIKNKIQYEKKQKLDHQIKKKISGIQKKKKQLNKLKNKYRNVKKLFQRNKQYKDNINNNINDNINDNIINNKSKKNKIIKKTYSNISTNQHNSNHIYQPYIFILLQQKDQKPCLASQQQFPLMIRTFSQSQIQLLAPYNNLKNTHNIKQKYLKMQQQQQLQYQQQQNCQQNEQNEQKQIQLTQLSNGTYSLLDLLQFLSLDEDKRNIEKKNNNNLMKNSKNKK